MKCTCLCFKVSLVCFIPIFLCGFYTPCMGKEISFSFHENIGCEAGVFLEKNKNCDFKIGHDNNVEECAFVLKKNDTNTIEGAIKFQILCGTLYIDLFIIGDKYRGKVKGLGTCLLKKAVDYAQTKNVRFVYLNTLDFHTVPFYEKFGAREEFWRTLFVNGSELKWRYLIFDNPDLKYEKFEQLVQNIHDNNFSITEIKHGISDDLDEYLLDQFTRYSKLFGYELDFADYCVIMKHEERIVGVATGCADTFNCFELQEFVIDPDYLSLAPDFVEAIITDLKSKDVNFIHIDTFNKKAKDLHLELGFNLNFERHGYIDDNGKDISRCYLSRCFF